MRPVCNLHHPGYISHLQMNVQGENNPTKIWWMADASSLEKSKIGHDEESQVSSHGGDAAIFLGVLCTAGVLISTTGDG